MRVTEYTFRAQTRRPLAARPRLPARRRRPPDPAVHRPGHGRGPARRDEPGLEAGGRPRGRPARRRAGHLRAGTKTPRPQHDPPRPRRRSGDDGGRRTRQPDPPIRRPALHRLSRDARKILDSETPALAPVGTGPQDRAPRGAGRHTVPQPAARRWHAGSTPSSATASRSSRRAPTARARADRQARRRPPRRRPRHRTRRLAAPRPRTAAIVRPDRTVMAPGATCRSSATTVPEPSRPTEEDRANAKSAQRRARLPTGHLRHRGDRRPVPALHADARTRSRGLAVRGSGSTPCRATPSAKPFCATTRRSSPARASRSTRSSTGSPAAPRSTVTAPNTISAASSSPTG